MATTSVLMVAPTAEPVDLDLAKKLTRFDDVAMEPQLESALVGAREQAERELGRALITQTRRLSLVDWPCSAGGCIALDYPPVQSVVSVEYWDGSAWLAVSGAIYELVHFNELLHGVVLKPGNTWPSLGDRMGPRVRVTFVAGFGDGPDDVPKPIQHWIVAMAGYEVENPTHVGEPPTEFLNRKLDAWRTRV